MTSALAALIGIDEKHDPYSDRILEAALDRFTIHGIRRTSVEDVAAAAGVGRVTIYRRFANKDALVRATVVRQLNRLHQEIAETTTANESRDNESHDIVDSMIDWFVETVHRLRDDRLVRRLIDTEPETVLPLITTGAAPLFMATTAIVLETYPGAREALGEHALTVTELTMRLATSLIVCPDGFASSANRHDTRNLAETFLVPALREHLKYVDNKNA